MLTPYTITAIERDEATAESTGKQVIVGATCSMFTLDGDNPVTLYDDADSNNGSTAKTTGINGQVTVYIEPGQYRLSVNGIDSYVTVGESVELGTAATEDTTTSAADKTGVLLAEHAYADSADNYHTGNANFNVFETRSGDYVETNAVSITTTAVRCDLALSSYSQPTSITNSVGSDYNVVDNSNGTVVATGILPTFSSTSTARNCFVDFAIPTDLRGKSFRVIATTDSTITVNF